MRLSPTIAFAAALLPWSVQAGMYGQPVLNLDARTFKQVMANEHAAMVAFVAPWCGHCRNLGPEYTAAASSLSPLIPFYAVDCDDQANKPLCAEYQIQGFPTIKAFPRAGKGAAKDYQGERKKGALIEYAKTLVPDRVKKLRVEKEGKEDAVIKGFLKEKPDLPHVLLVHPSAPSIPFLWKVLAHRLSGKMHLGFVRDTTSHTVLSSLGVFDPDDSAKDATRVVAFPAGATSKDGLAEYQGALKFNALLEWLQGQLDGTNPPSSQSESKQPKSTDQAQKTIKAESATTDDKKAKDAAARRAKMDEAERRDKERRERAAAAAAAKSAAGAASVEEVEGDTPDAAPDAYGTPGAVGGSGASKVEDAPEAVPQETVDPADGGSSYDAHAPAGGRPADPSPEQAPAQADGLPDEAEDSEAEKTEIVHEEL
ncbi:protein disulfide-isomerase domain [Kwoniella heveanensis BCC8398]|uniref:Protein disulfide-isomerase domain n=1 Tax=Kwoniella heveanensis BCC8398 TaxID=1296120 RepID=A0A1B9GQD5_9TREE|nr:protein disulfide-isomerase domain [Kwoniella heveanensis BCC8398]